MLVWHQNLSVGNDQIDTDHQQLLSIANKIELAFACGSSLAMIRIALAELVEYTEYHFEQIRRASPDYSAEGV